DHLDAGSVASPYRETEGMKDGSDAIADWPILNAMLNTAAGAHWVSVHHGGGVGSGYSIHAGMVVVADGTDDAAGRLQRVLTTDPGPGVIRRAAAGYVRAAGGALENWNNSPPPFRTTLAISPTRPRASAGSGTCCSTRWLSTKSIEALRRTARSDPAFWIHRTLPRAGFSIRPSRS